MLALDLSLTATGVFCGDPSDPTAPYILDEITTSERRLGESDVRWYTRRFRHFYTSLLDLLTAHQPELMVVEVTGHAHQWFTRGEGEATKRMQTTRGQEFRAGLGLGRAIGWLDGLLVLAEAYGCAPPQVELIEAKDAKLRVAGAQAASKEAVRRSLQETYRWQTERWRASQVDALAAGLGHLRTVEQTTKEARLRTLADQQSQTGHGSGRRSRAGSVVSSSSPRATRSVQTPSAARPASRSARPSREP